MTTPLVTEILRPCEPVARDPFIDGIERGGPAADAEAQFRRSTIIAWPMPPATHIVSRP